MKMWVGIAVGLTAVSGLCGFTGTARACSLALPGINYRSVWPGPEQALPTNARLVVTYNTSGGDIPAFGPDLVLLDADGSQIAATLEVLGTMVVVRPDGGLLPNHGYQLADRRTIPCTALATSGGCPLAAASQVFASFTTGVGADTAPPVFAGITEIGPGSHLTCDSSSCCGTYDVYTVDATWGPAADDVGGGDVRYNLYRRVGSSLTLKSPLVEGTHGYGTVVCSGDRGSAALEPGDYVVRAVDWAGNEDSNLAAGHLVDPCRSGTGLHSSCAVAASRPTGWSPWLAAAAGVVAACVAVRRRRAPRRR